MKRADEPSQLFEVRAITIHIGAPIAVVARGMSTLQTAIARMEAEYQEMPGLVLRRDEAERLLGLDASTCERALDALTRRRFLKRTPAGTYLRNRPG